jgi:DNA-binding transcriptional LysR family regulator
MALPRFTLNLARLDLVSVRLAVACAQTGSLTAAARECNLALAAASRRLKELELALGVRLFERRSSGLIPTTAAAPVIKRGLDMLGAVYELESTLADLRDGIARHVRLCASSAAINQFLPPLLARWHAHHPQVQVEVEEQVSGLVLTRYWCLRGGTADPGAADLAFSRR